MNLRATAGVGVVAELAEVGVLDLVADEGARNADLIATNDDDLLAGKELLGNDRGKATKKVVAAVDNDSLRHLDSSVWVDMRWGWRGGCFLQKNNLLNPLIVRSKAITSKINEIRRNICRHASKMLALVPSIVKKEPGREASRHA